jgi:hypothetical protein
MSWTARMVAVTVAALTLGAAGSAYGDATVHFNAKVRVIAHGAKMDYHGKVRSELLECQADRTIRISLKGHLIAQATTDEDGRFSEKADAVPDGSSVKFKLKPAGPECPALTLYVEI